MPQDSSKEKCYGIAKAGQNDCGTATPHVRRQVAKTRQRARRLEVRTKGTCDKVGGKTAAPKAGAPDIGQGPKYSPD